MKLPVPFALTIEDAELVRDDGFPGQVVEGHPDMSTLLVWESTDKTQIRGIWEVQPGTFTWRFDVDEFFVVLSGHATIEVQEGETLTLQPGSLAVFKPGDRTIWTVHETLRKGFHMSGL